MAEHPAEVTDITASAGALMLNLGNITDARIESMKRSMRTAMENKIPVLLDLVGVACSDLRLDLARELLSIGHPAVLKGNMSELLAVSGLPSHAIGIDAGAQDALTAENMETVSEVLRAFSRSNQAIVLATGKQDFVTDGERVVLVQNGSAALSGITGTGCMVGALTAAFLPGCEDNIAKEMTDSIEAGVRSGVEMELNGKSGNYLAAAVLGTALMGIAGEEAEKISRGSGSFQVNLLDEIYGLSDRQLLNLLKIECTEKEGIRMDRKDLDVTLYLVTDSSYHTEESLLRTVEEACKGGVTLVQLREKNKGGREYLNKAFKVKEITDRYNVPLIIDDRVDVALACDAAGVHVGASDIPVAVARKLMGPDKIVGATAKTVEAAVKAYEDGADYLGVGAIYPTTTKVVTILTKVSTLKDICEAVPIPAVAIGGLNAGNMDVLEGAGMSGMAVVSAIMKAEDPQGNARELKEKIVALMGK